MTKSNIESGDLYTRNIYRIAADPVVDDGQLTTDSTVVDDAHAIHIFYCGSSGMAKEKIGITHRLLLLYVT